LPGIEVSMKVQENFSLKSFNSFAVDVMARRFATFTDMDMLAELLEGSSKLRERDEASSKPSKSILVLGGGSNILFTSNFEGLVLKNEIRGISLIKEDDHHVYVKAGAGEDWHPFVLYCIQRNWAGIENLSLIPGKVGAGPIQNIGAYGVELKEVFEELEAFHLRDKKSYTLSVNDCQFGYRDSIFKKAYRGEFVILNATFRLNKVPRYHISYGNLKEELEKMGVKDLSIGAISQAVINIRMSKLPDPAKIGNAGSFFKNPVVSKSDFQILTQNHPGIIGYENKDGTVKLAAAWLIDQCGWKGFRKGDAGCHEKQALVLVNYGQATGKEILDLSEDILQSVKQQFGVRLEREVSII
jgi:UDP-N-acetylmuramate dehydrogenase